MKKIENTFNSSEKIKYPSIVNEYSSDGDIFLSIETTGLSPERHRISSVTLGRLAASKTETVTYFSESENDELTIIQAAIKDMKAFKRLVTFGGTNFDLKFLSKRAEVYAIRFDFNSSSVKFARHELKNFDLSQLLRPIRRFLPSESLSIYSLLPEMGLSDKSLPKGRTVTTLYKTYLTTGEKKYAEPVIDHSVYKVTGIMNALALLNCLKINKANPSLLDISRDEEAVTVNGTTDIFFPVELTFNLPAISLSFKENSLKGIFASNFPSHNGCIRIYLPDWNSYVRLKENGQLIPKELAKSLPKESYEKVTQADCYMLSPIPEDSAKAKDQLEKYIRQLIRM
ncbi:MAG: hypothetical protein DUD27_06395 [Lachnospiraceae bacterium]|uniref:YprB ribonuclease H-like domain-containing protein n=1 Tax=Candidatus Weimeria bifida TaxID=2599074 RepID=A0A6N7IWH6_9FIRM|nr:hypothetical protein [Candidatus Weimeria bifida]RRF96022.1 MAG: hypothetical protein DUD27_06395 [Lachnospiraceae bacterium]